MEYKLLYATIIYEKYGDYYSQFLCPVLYDSRNLKTREKILEYIRSKVVNFILNESSHLIEDREEDFGPIEFRESRFQNSFSDNILFNQEHGTKVLERASFEDHYNGDFYFYGNIYETTPELLKVKESDCEFFNAQKLYEGGMAPIMRADDLIKSGFTIKDLFYVQVCNWIPSYDVDYRQEYVGGFSTISKNLLGLLTKVKNEFRFKVEEFGSWNYDDHYSYDTGYTGRNDGIKLNELIKKNGQGVFNVINERSRMYYDNADGLVYINGIRMIPVVSYYIKGDKQCEEK